MPLDLDSYRRQLEAEQTQPGAPDDRTPKALDLDAFRKSLHQDNAAAIDTSLEQSIETNPEKRAMAVKMSKEEDIPTDIVESDQQRFEYRQQLRDARKALQGFPVASGWMGEPENAKLTHDAVDELTAFEKLAGQIGPPPPPRLAQYVSVLQDVASYTPEQVIQLRKNVLADKELTPSEKFGFQGAISTVVEDPESLLEQIKSYYPIQKESNLVGGGVEIAKALPGVGKQIVGSAASAIRAGDNLEKPGVMNDLVSWADEGAKEAMRSTGAADENTIFVSPPMIGDITYKDIRELPKNMGFSFVSMLAGVGVGVPIAAVPLPGARAAGWAAGTAASGVVAYRMAKDQIISQVREALNAHSISTNGVPVSDEDWRDIRRRIEGSATRYGLWEAIPEALSNAAGLKIIRMPVDKFMRSPVMRNILARGAAKYAGLMGTELLTETITQVGQATEEVRLGLRETVPTVAEAFKEVAPQTALLTTVMGGAGAAGSKAYDMTIGVQQAQRNKDVFEALNDSAEASKLRARSKDHYMTWIRAVKEKYGTPENVHIDPEALVTLMQDGKIDIDIDGLEEKIATAREEGHSVVVPLEMFQTNIAGTEAGRALLHDVKFAEDDMTINQSVKAEGEVVEMFTAEQAAAASFREEQRRAETPLERIQANVEQQLLQAGQTPANARHMAAIHRAHAKVLQERYGVDPTVQYGNLAIKGPLPASLRAPVEPIDLIIDRARAGETKSERKLFGESLRDFARRSGINDDRGDLAGQDIDKGLKPFQRKMLRPEGQPIDYLLTDAVEAGFFPEGVPSLSEFIDALIADRFIEGEGDVTEQQREQAASDLREVLHRLGVDIDTATNDEIKAALAASEQVEGGETFEQVDINSAAFKAWFGDSKVVDENGDPLVVYHSTEANIKEFDLRRFGKRDAGWYGKGIYLTGSVETANAYAGTGYYISTDKGIDEGTNIMPVFVSLQNPYMWPSSRQAATTPEETAAITKELIAAGHDGVIIPNRFMPDPTTSNAAKFHEIVAFSPTQVKSVFNRGTFDPNDPRILFQEKLLSNEDLRGFAEEVKTRHGLKTFDLFLRSDGSIELNLLVVDRLDQKSGKGSAAMMDLTSFADQNARRVVLSPAVRDDHHGTTSRSRLVKFYKRFGFVENKGRNKDFAIRDGMYRDPIGNKLNQENRGSIQFFPDDQVVINLGKAADLSTFLHESGHLFVNTLMQLADTNATAAADLGAMMKFAGVESFEAFNQTEAQEKLARAFEAYLREGKAPSVELQGAFARFRAWLINIYRTLKGLDVEIDDDVRGVFDRMLATDAEIAQAEQVNQFMAEPGIAEMMNEKERAAYADAAQVATDQAAFQLEKAKISEMAREETARWQEEYAVIRDEIAGQINAQPVYRAIDALRTATSAQKLSRDAVHDLVGAEGAKRLPHGLTRVSGGIHPDIVAEEHGFSSGDEMLFHMMGATKNQVERRALIDGLAQDAMQEQHGSLNENTAQAAEAASEIVHSDERGRFLAMELRALARATNGQATPASVAKAAAARIIAAAKSKDATQAGKYAAAEVRAATAKTKALLLKDLPAALEASRQQLLNHYLFMEARKAADEIDGMVRYFNKFKKRSKTLDVEYADQIDGMLERYDFRRAVSLKEIGRRKSLAKFVEMQNEAGEAVSIDEDLLNEARTQHYKDTSMEELRGLQDAVKHIEHLGRMKNKLQTSKDKRDLNEVVDEMAASIRENWTKKWKTKSASRTPIEKGLDWAKKNLSLRRTEFMMRELDGFKPGPMQETLWNIISDADDQLQVRRALAATAIRDLYEGYKWKETREWFTKKVFIPEINDSITKETMIAAALNQGTFDNKAKWLKGWGWSQEGLDAVLDKLEKRDWDMVQAKLDYLGTFWEETVALDKATVGKTAPKLEAIPIETKFGTYPGGYYRIKYELDSGTRIERNSVEETYKRLMMGDTGHPMTNKGRTIERVDSGMTEEEIEAGYSGGAGTDFKIRSDIGVFFEAVEEAIHDLSFRKAAIDSARILNHPTMKDVLKETIGEPGYATLVDWMRDGITGGLKTNKPWADKPAAFVRKRTTTMAMGWKLSTMFLQPLGIFNTLARLNEDAGIGNHYVLNGVKEFYSHPKEMMKWVHERSDFMAMRDRTWDRDAMNVLNSLTAGPAAKVEASYFIHIAKAQLAVDYPSWLAGYHWYRDEYPARSEEDAAKYANSVVRMAQGAGAEKDLAPIQKGGEIVRNFNLFMTFFSALNNMIMDQAKQLKRNVTPLQATVWSANMLFISVMPVVIEKAIYESLGVQGPDDDESVGTWLFKEWMMFTTGGIPGVRDAMSYYVGDFPYQASPTLGTIEKALNFPKQIAQAWEDDEVDRATVRTGLAAAALVSPVAVPAGQLMLFGDYLYDWYDTGNPKNPVTMIRRPPKHMRE